MPKRPAAKRLTLANLAELGGDRLAELLMQAAEADANLKRRLRFEVAAEGGAEPLAAELDKRLQTLGNSRARVSWRKRPELIADLLTLKVMIAERLALLDADGALRRLIAWFDLQPALSGRVRDSKGDLIAVFETAASELWSLASVADRPSAARQLADAIARSPTAYARWTGAGAEALTPELAKAILDALLEEGAPPAAARAVVRRLADRAGALDLWLSLITPAERSSPDFAAATAMRLVEAGRLAEARSALEAATRAPPMRWSAESVKAPTLAFEKALIALLDAEGSPDEAQALRWRMFERDLDADALQKHLSRLPDFEDVEALDRAFAHAAAFPDFIAGMRFLMNWPAHREAAQMALRRRREAQRPHADAADWSHRLAQRFPEAAEVVSNKN